jgi:hypothetical protein
VRLHLPGDKASRDWKSCQEGLHLLAQGAFAGIRNPATHSGDEWTEQEVLEHLAVLSVVARWSDRRNPSPLRMTDPCAVRPQLTHAHTASTALKPCDDLRRHTPLRTNRQIEENSCG